MLPSWAEVEGVPGFTRLQRVSNWWDQGSIEQQIVQGHTSSQACSEDTQQAQLCMPGSVAGMECIVSMFMGQTLRQDRAARRTSCQKQLKHQIKYRQQGP